MDDDDDEFGELYADVLRPIAAAAPAPTLPPVPILPPAAAHDFGGGVEDEILSGGSGSAPAGGTPSSPHENLDPSAPPVAENNRDDDWMLGRAPPDVDPPDNWDDEEGTASPRPREVGAPHVPQAIEPRVLEDDEEAARVSRIPDEDGVIGEAEAFGASKQGGHRFFGGGVVENLGNPDEAPIIPGLSAGPGPSGALLGVNSDSGKPSRGEDWDSDSEDDLQIVLNDNNHVPFGVEKNDRIDIDDDDDEEEDLVIVTDKDQHPLSAMEGQDWGEETMQPIGDGERNEITDVAKETSATGTAPGVRIGHNNHGFQAQHHSMYKYIRPGAAPLPGLPGPGTAAPLGAARPLGFSGGRGDWRPSGGRGIPNASKSHHTGFGFPAWPNSSAHAFGSGLDFSLPAHKIIFDIDIESFEEKPWRCPGVDISDFFNFELDEDKWKDYCKHLAQLRLESTMQSKIRVYESGRSEQGYDPDLPPELAAAAGHHDISAVNGHGKTDDGESDFASHGKGPAVMRPPPPIGRAIQVECGYRERLPSIDTRPPRYRDSDSIIEIALQDSFDDPQMYNCSPEHHEIGKGEDNKAFNETDKHDKTTIIGYINQHPHTSSSGNKEMTRTLPSKKEKDDALHLPSESFAEYHEDSRTRTPESPAGASEKHHRGRLPQGSPYKGHSISREQSIDSIPTRSAHSNSLGNQQEAQEDSTEVNQSSRISPVVADRTATELHIEEKYGEHDEELTLLDSAEIEREGMALDFRTSSQTDGDDNLVHSDNKKKLGSRVEQPAVDDGGYEDELQTWSSGTSREKSGSSKDYPKLIENGEDIQERGSRAGYSKRPHKEDEGCLRKKDESGLIARQDVEKNRIASKGREAASNSYQHPPRSRSYERRKESESSNSSWHRRDDNLHNKRSKDDTRRENSLEMASRHKNRNQTDDHSRKHVDGKEWRGHNRDGVLGKRERNDFTMSRYENIDDLVNKRKRDEDFLRGKADKVDAQQGHRDREDFGRRKRERDDDLDSRRKEVDTRMRDKTEDHLSSKHKDDNWRYRERADRQKLKSHESAVKHREREGQRAPRSGRGVEDKPLDSNGRNKNDLNTTNYDKDYREKERKRHNEHSRRDRAREDNVSQNKGQGDVSALEKHSITDERRSRHERLNTYSDCAPSAAAQHTYRERHRENARKAKDAESHEQNSQGLGKRKHEDHCTAQSNEKVFSRGLNEQESKNISSKTLSKKEPHQIHELHETLQQNSMRQGEALDDENQGSRKGRSKLERWTSHQERDYNVTDNTNTSNSSKLKNIEGSSVDVEQADELAKAELNCNTVELDGKVVDEGQASDKMADEQERHLDTVAKLKRRSERFKLPMLKEKEIATSKTLENDVQPSNNEAVLNSEVKPERPARKRRWTGN